MSLIGKPFGYKRTKFCFVYCGPERCDCGVNDPACADSIYFPTPEPTRGVEVVPEDDKKHDKGYN